MLCLDHGALELMVRIQDMAMTLHVLVLSIHVVSLDTEKFLGKEKKKADCSPFVRVNHEGFTLILKHQRYDLLTMVR